MRAVTLCALLCGLLTQVTAIAMPFADDDYVPSRRNNNQCPRVVGKYGYCDAVTLCCQPGYGCNTCGEGNVGQTCVERRKDNCKSDKDCYYTQKCINNGKEASFCAQLWVDDRPGGKSYTATKTSTMTLMPSSLAPSSLFPSSLFPSSLFPSSMGAAPTQR